jgi:hypothetical protein
VVCHRLATANADALVIKCRGADLVRSKCGLNAPLVTPNDYINDWMIRLCALVNRELAQRMNLALTDDKITLIDFLAGLITAFSITLFLALRERTFGHRRM